MNEATILEFENEQLAYNIVANAIQHDVQVRIETSEKNVKRHITALRDLTDEQELQLPRQILLGRRIDTMPTYGTTASMSLVPSKRRSISICSTSTSLSARLRRCA